MDIEFFRASANNWFYNALADEPTGDLDEETEEMVMAFLASLNRERGTTIILVTHSAALAQQAPLRCTMRQGVLNRVR